MAKSLVKLVSMRTPNSADAVIDSCFVEPTDRTNTPTRLNRRAMLVGTLATAAAATSAAPPQRRLIIDTHLEVWTFSAKFPFNHPEQGRDLNLEMEAPIENQVSQMEDFGLRYAVLINPRYFSWDNSYIAHCLKTYPKLFVAHGLLDPEHPKLVDNLRYWVQEHGFQGMRFCPIYHPRSPWLNWRAHAGTRRPRSCGPRPSIRFWEPEGRRARASRVPRRK